jgi:Ca2+-binding RTX toxin-like protein
MMKRNRRRPESGRVMGLAAAARCEPLETRVLLSGISFSQATNFTTPIADPFAEVSGDVNGDGQMDVVTISRDAAGASVFLGKGNGTFQPPISVPLAGGGYDLALADVNGDGKLDLIVGTVDSDQVGVLLGNGDGTFGAEHMFTTGSGQFAVQVADLNGDGKLDIITTNEFDNTISILYGNGDGTFQPHHDIAAGNRPRDLKIGDLTGDGRPDIVVANYSDGTISVLLNQGGGSFTSSLTGVEGNPFRLFLADLNNDGHLDLVSSNVNVASSVPGVSVLLGTGNGTFIPAESVGYGGSSSVVVADFNGDGNPDLAFTASGRPHVDGQNVVAVLRGNGDGTFRAARYYSTPVLSRSLLAVDLNGDGTPDLVTVNGYGQNKNISVLLNQAKFPFAFLENGILTVTGTPGADTIHLDTVGTSITATLNGVTSGPFPLADVTSIDVLAIAGNDHIRVNNAVPPTKVSGGTGADMILARNDNDTIVGGAGTDSITAGAGTNTITIPASATGSTFEGTGGTDTLVDSAPHSTVFGGSGSESVRFTATATAPTFLGAGAANNPAAQSPALSPASIHPDFIDIGGTLNVQGIGGLFDLGTGGSWFVTVHPAPSKTMTTLEAEGASGMFAIKQLTDVLCGSGNVTATVDQTATGSQITGGSGQAVIDDSAPQTTIHGGSGSDTVTLESTATQSIESQVGSTGNTQVTVDAPQCTVKGGSGDLNFAVESTATDAHVEVGAGDASGTVNAAGGDISSLLGLGGGNYFVTMMPGATKATTDLFNPNSNINVLVQALMDTVIGGGHDTVNFAAGADDGEFIGGDIGSLINDHADNTTITGGSGADSLHLSGNADGVMANMGAGPDTIVSSGSDDTLVGGAGADNITDSGDSNMIHGSGGADTITATTSSSDTLAGNGGDDNITGTSGDDINGGPGDNTITD